MALPAAAAVKSVQFIKTLSLPEVLECGNDNEVQRKILMEDYSEARGDPVLVREFLIPYLRDAFNDLTIRCLHPKAVKVLELDKLTFVQFTRLPVIMGERLFTIMMAGSSSSSGEQQ